MLKLIISVTNPVPFFTNENFPEWIIKIRAQLRQKKLRNKHKKAADTITLIILFSIMQKLIESEFNDGYLLFQRIKVILQSIGEAQFMRLSKEFYILQFKKFKTVDKLFYAN
jgi:hypothetical protein